MPRPPSHRAPRALSLAGAVLLGALGPTACRSDGAEDCPGEVVGVFGLQARRVEASTACTVEPAGGWAATVPETIPAELAGDPEAVFPVTLAQDPRTGAVALCTGRDHEAVLRGVRSGDHVQASAAAGEAVLSACAATCTAALTVAIEGDLAFPAGGPPTLAGTLVETYGATGGACAPCALPCTASYAFTAVAR
ncbi:conserved hypothetical protein [Anaeromyxobacter dehalogenans 2CP-1]|uniref:Lipoprotein n=1 Tax=Anaeromyxobacter dehalogenans (strain ATCC BAA-258 / DSM 21875 / 2CP-1) TaxID=455488 RepID=B8J8H8_ANAD2|nr:hypothetical protein [Anaeromyxobacter dehalogenans]ACL67264.1 conserved hypothetical protein [Anaeromyxobacter dehalogenans 2CP-1]